MPSRYTWRTTLFWFACSRLIIAVIGFIGVATFLDQRSLEVGGPLAFHVGEVWRKWDVLWYERIALHGYGWHLEDVQGQAAAGFFPLYPLLVGAMLRVVPFISFFWLGTLVSNLCSAVALALAAEHLTTNPSQARWTLVLVAASAGSFYLSIPYTEGLFFLLTTLVLILARRGRLWAAAVCAGLAAVTRAQGLALIAVPVAACLTDGHAPLGDRLRRSAGLVAVFAVPFALYAAYLSAVQGSAGAFVARQAMWDNSSPYPLRSIVGLWEHPRRLSGWLHGGYWAVYAGLLVRYWKRLPLGEALFCAGALLISTQQDTFHGIYRYITPLLPLELALAGDRAEWRHAFIVGNVIFATIMILAFVTWNRLAV
jgi:hypothetical protein